MSRRVIENTEESIDDVDTVPEVQGGWRKPNAVGEVGIRARGICGVYRKTFGIILLHKVSRVPSTIRAAVGPCAHSPTRSASQTAVRKTFV